MTGAGPEVPANPAIGSDAGRLCPTPARRILDVGCGDGLFLDKLAPVEVLEPDASLLTETRWRSSIRVETLGPGFVPDESYDLILMLDVLEQIADDRGALRAGWSALRPGGFLLLTVPTLPWLWSRHDEANEHHRRYRPRTLRSALLDAGFVVETLRYAFTWTVAPMVLRKWLAPAGASEGVADYAIAIPTRPINLALTALSRSDHALGRVIPWPIGSSLIAVARRPATDDGPRECGIRPRRTVASDSRRGTR